MDITDLFEKLGGTFISPEKEIKRKLKKVKAFIFDWDGVFNDGSKTGDSGSNFSEPDAMGLNMLKFSYWLREDRIPYTFIVTGEENQSAQFLAKREHMHGAFYQCKFKVKALERICIDYQLLPEEIAFVFDDVLDVELARSCGVSFQINRKANPIFNQYLQQTNSCDYRSANTGGQFGVREVCELIIGCCGDMGEAIEKRIEFTGDYTKYLEERNKINTIVQAMK